MADINSSLDEILTELGDSYDADIAASGRKITRSTANKIWLQLRAFSRGLYSVYQVVASLRYRFDPLYCTDDELESTMRLVGTTRIAGKTSLLTVTIWNEHDTTEKILPIDTYYFVSANGVEFSLLVQEAITVQPNSFMKRDFYSSLGGEPYIGSFSVSENTGITITNKSGVAIDDNFTFDCADNSTQLGRAEESLFEVRQRILTDNQRQEVLHILEERLRSLPNIHECTIMSNKGLTPIDSDYMQDDGVTPVQIMPQSIMVIMTGSPTSDFALQVLTLCPFITVPPVGVAVYGTVFYESDIYYGGMFPVYYLPHRIATFDVIIQYGYASSQVSNVDVESDMTDLILDFRANTKFIEIISAEDFSDALSSYQNPSVKILSISFDYESTIVSYMRFSKTQIARLDNIIFQQVQLWS